MEMEMEMDKQVRSGPRLLINAHDSSPERERGLEGFRGVSLIDSGEVTPREQGARVRDGPMRWCDLQEAVEEFHFNCCSCELSSRNTHQP